MKKLSIPSSINVKDDISLSTNEYNILHNFFVTYSLCKNLSKKKRTLKDYGYNKISNIKKLLELIPIDKGTKARIVIKVNTLLKIIEIIDINKILY